MKSYLRFLVALFATMFFLFGLQSGVALAVPTTPTTDFTDNGDGTATHRITGLTWKRCSEGQAWSGSTCTGTAQTYTWAQATALTSTFAGNSDWRLPTIAELKTIVERDTTNPAINGTMFPNTPASYFWSISIFVGNSNHAWPVSFSNGDGGPNEKTLSHEVRLVRGGQTVSSAYTPISDFSDQGNGVVSHNKTNLTWKRCTEGQIWNGSTCTGNATTYTWAAATALTQSYAGYADWRLPTVSELITLVEWSATNFATNGTVFPNISTQYPSYFWSTSAYAGNNSSYGDSSYAWVVEFFNGTDGTLSKSSNNQVRLVRGVQSVGTSPSVSLIGISLSCPTTLTASASGTCSATASYSDFTSKSVSPVWSSSNPAALSVNGSGSLAAGAPVSDTTVTITASYTEGGTKTGSSMVIVKAAPILIGIPPINCPSTLNADASGSCTTTATASYSDGSSKAVSPTWSSSNPAVLFVDSSGRLTAGAPSTDTTVTITASYSEGGITKTTTASITVKAAIAKLTGLTISGDTSVKSGAGITLTAKGSYSDGTSRDVSATWVSSDPLTATVTGAGLVTAKTITTDTPVTITAIYTENGVTQTAIWMVSVKAVPVVLTDLILSGADTLEAGKTATYTAKAVYSDGNSKAAGNITWSSSGTGATIDAQGVLTADAKLSADAVVTITAIYTENGVAKTAQMKITIKVLGIASACSGSGANLSAITVVGSPVKTPGDSLEIDYCLKNYNSATWFDVYIAAQLPDGTLLFMQSAGFFDTPTFTAEIVPYLANTLIPDKSGTVLQISALSMGLPTGTYTFYAIPVLAGKNVMTGFNWVGQLASGKINFNR